MRMWFAAPGETVMLFVSPGVAAYVMSVLSFDTEPASAVTANTAAARQPTARSRTFFVKRELATAPPFVRRDPDASHDKTTRRLRITINKTLLETKRQTPRSALGSLRA